METNIHGLKPVLKWAGGKRQILREIITRMPQNFNSYYEPFLGGASVLLALLPANGFVGDLNEELINVYSVIREYPNELIRSLKNHKEHHCSEYYYKVRSLDRSNSFITLPPYERAARTIYLNRTCYNGLYRVNSKGYFNTPIGKYTNPQILDEKTILSLNDYFKSSNIVFLNGSYETITSLAKKDDFVYLDPPYDIISPSASFTDYTKYGFNRDDQKALKTECDRMNKEGVLFMESNSDTPFIRELYVGYNIYTVKANRSINSNARERKNITEVIITNYGG